MPMVITRGAASAKGFGWSSGGKLVVGQQAYTTGGTYSWVAPTGVTKVSVVAIGAGGRFPCGSAGAGGGGLGYKNNISVTPGSSYTVVVIQSQYTGTSYFSSAAIVGGISGTSSTTGGSYIGDGGGQGGTGRSGANLGGGGAGGYSATGNSGSGGSGANGNTVTYGYGRSWQGGGGVGIFGSGTAGTPCTGAGGSGGGNGGLGVTGCCSGTGYAYGGNGGAYGGATGGANCTTCLSAMNPGCGAVRIIWPGCARSFPSTRTANE